MLLGFRLLKVTRPSFLRDPGSPAREKPKGTGQMSQEGWIRILHAYDSRLQIY
jgi:hypothetical protein